jgi:hypothetical protein
MPNRATTREENEMTRPAREAVFLLACAIALAGLPAGYAHAQTFDPQPYLVYMEVSEVLNPAPLVQLEDQFGSMVDVPVETRLFFMNPVEKDPVDPEGETEVITDPSLHYGLYRIDVADPGTTHVVRVDDQFGRDIWLLQGSPEYLLAPASKSLDPGEPGPPPTGQHYVCYFRNSAGSAPGPAVDLTDQFGTYTNVILDLPGAALCVPVEKTDDFQEVFPIISASDGRDHLACYAIHNPDSLVEVVYTRTQFTGDSPDERGIVGTFMLCLPAVKTHVSALPSLRSAGIVALGLLMILTVFLVARRRVRHAGAA